MNALQTAIDKAVKEQYPEGNKPTFLQVAHAKSDKDRWVDHFDLQLRNAGFIVHPAGAFDKLRTGVDIPTRMDVFREFRFHPERMWRFDRAWPALKLAVEIDGGGFGRVVTCHRCKSPVMRTLKDGRTVPIREGGRHNTGAGMDADHEKHNAAAALGWRVLRFTPRFIRDSSGINLVAAMTKG